MHFRLHGGQAYLEVAQRIHQVVGQGGYIKLANILEVARLIEFRRISSRPTEFGGDDTSLEVYDLLTVTVDEHIVDVFRDRDPVIGAVTRKSTFRRLPVARHVDLSLDRG